MKFCVLFNKWMQHWGVSGC